MTVWSGLVAGYVLDASPANTDILERFRQYDARRNNTRTIVKKHLIWQLGSEYGVSFTPEESEKVIAQEYSSEAKANTPAAEAAKERILHKMEVMGISESATLDQLESDCLARLCTGYQAADEKTCGAMLERIHAYPAQEKMKELYLKKAQGRIEEIWSAEDGEIFDSLYLKTNIKDQAQKDAAIAYIKEKGRTDSSSKYPKAVTNCTPDNIKKATAYVSWNLCMAISAAILIMIGAILLIAFHTKIYFCAIPILVGCILLYSRSKLKEAWNILTIREAVFHSQIFSEHMPTGKTPVMPVFQVCIVVLLAVSGAFLLIQANASKNVASKTPIIAATVDATPDYQEVAGNNDNYDDHLQLPAENNYDSAAPATDDSEQSADTQEDTQEDSDSFIYKGSSYEDILGEVADNFPAAMYALFDMTADGSPELVVKTGTSQATARYDIYSLQDNNTLYVFSHL